MGSLASHPKIKAPATPSVVYTSTPTTPAPSSGSTPTSSTSNPSSGGASGSDIASADTGANNLLLRDRGIFGTALTGFRGLLALADNAGQRKTLLGE